VSTKSRIAVALVSVFIGLLLMGAAHDKPDRYFGALGIIGLVLFVGGPLWAFFRKRSEHTQS